MDPITIAILAAIFGGAAVVALLKWPTIKREIDVSKIPKGFAKVIDEGLRGPYRVVSIGIFDSGGTRRKSKTWKAKQLDSDLQSRFSRAGGVIRVET